MTVTEPTRAESQRSLAGRIAWQGFVAVVATLYAAFVPLDLVVRFSAGHPFLIMRWLAPLVFLVDLVATAIAYARFESSRPSVQFVALGYKRWILGGDLTATLSLGAILGSPVLGLLGLAKLIKVAAYMHQWRRQQLRHASRLLLVYGLF